MGETIRGDGASPFERPQAIFGSFAPPEAIRVLLADDHPLMIAALRRTLEEQEAIEVVGQAQTAAQTLALAARRAPHVILMDLCMPGVSGFELIESLRGSCPGAQIVVLSASGDQASVQGALRAGAKAFIVKTAAPMDIVTVIRQVRQGAAISAPVSSPGVDRDGAGADLGLTDRERTILAAIAAGQTTAAISRELWISEHTIKFHLTNIYRKLGVANRVGAVRWWLEHGPPASEPRPS